MTHPPLTDLPVSPLDPMDRDRYPVDPWRLVELEFSADDLGRAETVFAVGNGYLGLRGNLEEGRDTFAHGTFVNGFHETWPIRHAEEAYGFARVGQTIVNAPDAKLMKLYVDDEPLLLTVADLTEYERVLDFRSGVLERCLVWRTNSGKRVRVRSRRMVSLPDRHLAMLTFEVTVLDHDAPVVISSQLLNRQDGEDEYHVRAHAMGEDPRKAAKFEQRVLQPQVSIGKDGRLLLGYRCTNSGMTLAVGAHHQVKTDCPYSMLTRAEEDSAKVVLRVDAKAGQQIMISKYVSYHTSRGVPARELSDRCRRTLDRAVERGADRVLAEQRAWLDDFWARSDVEIHGQPGLAQALRWNIFQLAQASARAESTGVPAKGVTGPGYGGHYFWDTEVYVAPFLTYTSPPIARNLLRFRYQMLGAARRRAGELNQAGALFPWRTINGEEASAYYAAGTAQYHIDADVSYALSQYVQATGDTDFLDREAADILVETARMFADLGFWRANGTDSFHIHGVTGPDEYTTVVNDNLFTNVMARFNLRRAAAVVRDMAQRDQGAYTRLCKRLALQPAEVEEWERAAEAMAIPFDEQLGIHPQDAYFLDREVWDVPRTPQDKRPLLLHYHPLVIYRFQVLKQADVVLALFLQGDQFTPAQKQADFDYYDPITTGDSTLSGCVQSIIASEVGYADLALAYYVPALFVDLADLHQNASDGVHVASTGGSWSAAVFGFGGLRDHGGALTLDPRLPCSWEALTFRITVRGLQLRVHVASESVHLSIEDGPADGQVELSVRGTPVVVRAGEPVVIEMDTHGPVIEGAPSSLALTGARRGDGTVITAIVPTA
ncbi:MAG: glycoside hydrolase family 65 protein [Actinomycetota bacterium]|nr:glycoside hydrolase family 65 protein [Actinomycetota bacterium]